MLFIVHPPLFFTVPHPTHHLGVQPLFFSREAAPAEETLESWYSQTMAQAHVLEVLTLEAYCTEGNIEAPLQKAMDEFAKKIGFTKWTFFEEITSKRQAEAQVGGGGGHIGALA